MMAKLINAARQLDYDALYRRIVQAHRGLTAEESLQFDARLILLLANHIGDLEVIEEALALARETGQDHH
jgi:hypothetical protein